MQKILGQRQCIAALVVPHVLVCTSLEQQIDDRQPLIAQVDRLCTSTYSDMHRQHSIVTVSMLSGTLIMDDSISVCSEDSQTI